MQLSPQSLAIFNKLVHQNDIYSKLKTHEKNVISNILTTILGINLTNISIKFSYFRYYVYNNNKISGSFRINPLKSTIIDVQRVESKNKQIDFTDSYYC